LKNHEEKSYYTIEKICLNSIIAFTYLKVFTLFVTKGQDEQKIFIEKLKTSYSSAKKNEFVQFSLRSIDDIIKRYNSVFKTENYDKSSFCTWLLVKSGEHYAEANSMMELNTQKKDENSGNDSDMKKKIDWKLIKDTYYP
jgi:hypothetical protein